MLLISTRYDCTSFSVNFSWKMIWKWTGSHILDVIFEDRQDRISISWYCSPAVTILYLCYELVSFWRLIFVFCRIGPSHTKCGSVRWVHLSWTLFALEVWYILASFSNFNSYSCYYPFPLFVTVQYLFILSAKEVLKILRPRKHKHFYERKKMNFYLTKKGAKCGILAASEFLLRLKIVP